MDFNTNRFYTTNVFIIILLLSTAYLAFFTKEHYFFLDDFYYIIGPKLYMLITEERLKLFDVFSNIGPQDHYAPLYYYYLQFMPANAELYHFVTILFHSTATLFVFLIATELIQDKKVALIASMLYFFNMSIHSWPIVWNAFNAHIINSVPGFFAFYLSIKYLKMEKENSFLLLFLISFFTSLTIFIYESGFLYLVLIFLFLILNSGPIKNKVKVLCSLSLPVIIYFSLTYNLSGNIHPILDRYNDSTAKNFYRVTNVDPNSLYAKRSNYAERNFTNYSIRLSENLLNTLNLGTLELIVKESLNKKNTKEKFKLFLNKYKNYFILIFALLLILSIIILIKIGVNKYKDKVFRNLLFYYLTMIIVTSVIYFRKDLGMAFGFSASLFLSYVLINFFKKNNFFVSLFLISYFILSIIYIKGGMEFAHVDYQKSLIKKNFLEVEKFVNSKDINNPYIQNVEYKLYYFYKNYDHYKTELKDFANNNSHDFHSFAKNFSNFKNY